ncbi:TPA: hypothetical protein H1016_01490 [archaeon]|uniref:Uncharacterized protein n=1 Tax=Candidatus Naiadarchaeum limnaeum TaxID=2756139 RepID=A0A832V153_9ARCH|nr:hypothetical protein [Candidatus Naiadarchaeum limnaeum]
MAKIILPDTIFGISVDGAMEREKTAQPTSKQPIIKAPAQNLNGFVYVPSLNLHIAEKRELTGKTWNKAVEQIYTQGIIVGGMRAEMPTPYEFMVFINDLIADRIPIPQEKAKEILDDILKIGDYRGNHLNAKFVFDDKGFNKFGIETIIFDSAGKPYKETEPLGSCLFKDEYADITKFNKQGLLTHSSDLQNYAQGKNLYAYYPELNGVARADAVSCRVDLYCDGRPGDRNASLGVRFVLRAKK